MENLVYKLPESLQISDTQALLKKCEAFLATQRKGTLFIDFADNKTLNSLTLGCLIKLNNLCRRQESKLILKNLSESSLEILHSTGLIHVFAIDAPDDSPHINASGAGVSLAIEMDFEFYREVGIFRFSGSMLTPKDADLFFNTAKKILVEGHKMLIDMSGMVFIDSMGIGAIIRIYQIMKEHKGEIRICGAGDILRELLDRQSLSSLIRIYNTADEALSGWV